MGDGLIYLYACVLVDKKRAITELESPTGPMNENIAAPSYTGGNIPSEHIKKSKMCKKGIPNDENNSICNDSRDKCIEVPFSGQIPKRKEETLRIIMQYLTENGFE